MPKTLLLFNHENATEHDIKHWHWLHQNKYDHVDKFIEAQNKESWLVEYHRLLGNGWYLTEIGGRGNTSLPAYRFERTSPQWIVSKDVDEFRASILTNLKIGQSTVDDTRQYLQNHEWFDKNRQLMVNSYDSSYKYSDITLRAFGLVPELESSFDSTMVCALRVPRQSYKKYLKGKSLRDRFNLWLTSYLVYSSYGVLCLFKDGVLSNIGVDLQITGL